MRRDNAHLHFCVRVEVIGVEHDHREREHVWNVALLLALAFPADRASASLVSPFSREAFLAHVPFARQITEQPGITLAVASRERFHDAIDLLRLGGERGGAEKHAQGDVESELFEGKETQEGPQCLRVEGIGTTNQSFSM